MSLLSSLISSTAALSWKTAISTSYLHAFNAGAALAQRVRDLACPYFNAMTGLFHIGYGSSEFASQSIKRRINEVPPDVLQPSKNYLTMHGALTIATGACSIIEALDSFGWFHYGKAVTFICSAGSVFFIYANVLSLEENIRIYEEAKRREAASDPLTVEHLQFIKHTSICGILSNLGYIFATACLLFGGPTAFALLVGVIASFCGGLKILCEFFHQQNWIPPSTL